MRTKLSVGAVLVALSALFFLLTPARALGGDRIEIAAVASVSFERARAPRRDAATPTEIAFLAEGYAPTEGARFLADAHALIDRLERSPAAEPMRAARDFSYRFVFVPSKVRASARRKPATTPFRARVEDERVSVDAVQVDAALRLAPRADVAVALVRFATGDGDGVRATAHIPRFDDETYEPGRIALPASEADDFLHELAHALWALGDEYAEEDAPLDEARRSAIAERANLSVHRDGARWRWVQPALGHAYEGAGRLRRGVFRPEADCIMRDLAAPRFCAVCRAILAGAFDADPADPIALSVAEGPLEGPLLVAGVPVSVTWRSPRRTACWELVVARISRRVETLVARTLEGQELEATLPALEPGRYEVRLRARNTGPHRGGWVTLGFTVAAASPGDRD